MIFFTADTHFGHENIIEHCNRPFSSLPEMDAYMVQRWNALVTPADTIYHLGDFAWVNPPRYATELNGTKILIMGNHDHRQAKKMFAHFGVTSDVKIITIDGHRVAMCHYPLLFGDTTICLHGHRHGSLEDWKRVVLPKRPLIDIGVDCWAFAPVSWPEILSVAQERARI